MKRLFFLILFSPSLYSLNVAVIGVGYVGLNTGAGLASIGHTVACADIDPNRIHALQRGECPLFEPGLPELLQKNYPLTFTTDIDRAIQKSEIVFIAVGTPPLSDGNANLEAIKSVAQTIGRNLNSDKTIFMRSTVPVGTHVMVKKMIEQEHKGTAKYIYISHPEFLREGTALYDFMHPHFLLFGTDDPEAMQSTAHELYQPMLHDELPFIFTDIKTAEMVKYAINTFLATKISYVNDLANLCDAVHVDVESVTETIKHDPRIGPLFLKPGPGFGGSCLPKDSDALLTLAKTYGVNMNVLKGAIKTNNTQPQKILAKVKKHLGLVAGKKIALWGLAFKSGTDDIRFSPAIPVIDALLKLGAQLHAYDPQASNNMQKLFPEVVYADSALEAATQADALLILTEWQEFKEFDYKILSQIMSTPVIIDGRNIVPKRKPGHRSPDLDNYIIEGIGTSCRYH